MLFEVFLNGISKGLVELDSTDVVFIVDFFKGILPLWPSELFTGPFGVLVIEEVELLF